MLLLLFLAQYPEHTTDTVRVLGARLPPGFSGTMTSLWITDSPWINPLPGQSVDQALLFSPGVHTAGRGLPGIQSDITAGSGNYTQTAVMVNGIRIDDPQTAHHSADVPLGIADLERVEAARGGASSLAGPGASSGAVNLVTSDPLAGARAGVFVGLFGTTGGGAEAGKGEMSLGISGARSDGYRPGSDYRTWRLTQKTNLGGARAFASYSWKGFGARDFYAPYPSREWTSCGIFTLNWGGFSFGARRHRDRFVLLEDNPEFYENNHTKTSALCSWNAGLGPGFGGWEISWWELSSDRLGYHQAPGAAVFYQAGIGTGPITFAIGVRDDWRDGTGFAPSLNAGISCALWEITGRVSGSLATRFPSATEMYYQDPKNTGNSALLSEKTRRAEMGLAWQWLSAGAFATDFENLIDWVWDDKDERWEAINLEGIRAYGAYLEMKARWFYIAWWYQKKLSDQDYESKYALRTPSNSVKLGMPWLFLSWEDGVCLVSGKVSFTRGPLTMSLFGDNLLNQSYEQVPGLPGPPRNLGVGFVFSTASQGP
ncbi:MAG: TonB-dependent receptor plug domain-containing protein [candidate division WOR-3 bacterium]